MPEVFRGLRWDPTNEQEVVLLFGQVLDHLPRALAIEYIHTTFPDCKAIALDRVDGQPLWIEFELFASHYRPHLKRPEKCDLIVCWHNDVDEAVGQWPEIIALDKVLGGLSKQYIANPRPVAMPDEEYFRLRVAALSRHHRWAIEQILDFAKTPGLGLQTNWPKTNGACFTVSTDRVDLFKVSSDGRIGTPFSRWKGRVSDDVIAQVAGALNGAFGKTWFRPDGKRGADIAQSMPDETSVHAFIDVWRKFVRANKDLQPSAASASLSRRG